MTNESLRLGNVSLTSRKLRTIILSIFVLFSIGNMRAGTDKKIEGFQAATASTTYNSTSTVAENKSDCGIGWSIYYGSVSKTQAITGDRSCLIRYYTADSKFGYAKTTTAIKGLKNITFKAKVTHTGCKMGVWYSTDGSNWSEIATNVTLTTSAQEKSYNIPNSSPATNYYIKIGMYAATTNKKDLIVDSIAFTYTAYTITYNDNGKTSGSVPTDATKYLSGATVTVKDNTGSLEKTNYTFSGWNTKADGSGADKAANSTFTITQDTTLYAKWIPDVACGSAPTVSAGSIKGSVSSSSSATVQCTSGVSNIGGVGCSMTSYGFAVGTSANPTIGGTLTGTGKTYEVGSSIAASTGFEKLIDGLAATTTYHVRSYATNGAGTGYGADFTFTTLAACTAAPTVTEGSKGTITSTTAAVTCSSGISSLGTGGCEITSYGFVYGTSANPTTSNSTKEVGKTYTSTGVSFNTSLTGLTEGQFYYVRPYATNGFGTNYGTQVSFGTPKITVSETARAFGDRAVGGSYTMTFTVSGTYLQGNISIAKSGTNQAMFSIDNATITQTDGTAPSTTITVTYSPSAAGSHSATLTLTSTNATSKTVSLSGTGKWKATFLNGNGGEHATALVANGSAPSKPGSNPAACDASSTTFIGWTQSAWSSKQNQSFIDGRTAANVKVYKSSDNLPSMSDHVTYYPVYALAGSTPTNSYAAITSGLESGNYVIAYSYNGGTQIVLKNEKDGGSSNTYMEGEALSLSSSKYSNPGAAYIWALQQQNDGTYYIYNANISKYLNATESSLQPSTTPVKFTISYDSGNSRWTIQLTSSDTYYTCGYVNGSIYYWQSTTSGSGYKYRVYLYKQEYETTYSDYMTTCCSSLTNFGGSLSLTSVSTSARTFGWTKESTVSDVDHYELSYKEKNAGGNPTSIANNISNNTNSYKHSANLTAGATYTYYLKAIGGNGHCDAEETLDVTIPQITLGSASGTSTYIEGYGPGSKQTFTVTAVGLTGDLTVTAPTNFEVCDTENGTYASSKTLTPTSGAVSTTVYFRLVANKTAASSPYAGSVTVSGGSATSQTVSVNGTVSPACHNPNITAGPVSATYNINASAAALTVTASKVDNNDPTLTYQWYSNTTNDNTSGTIIQGETGSSYTPPTAAVNTRYYYCVVHSGACESTSTCAAITVNQPTLSVSETARAFGDREVNAGPYEMTFTVSGTYLGSNIVLEKTGSSAFTIDKTSISYGTGTVSETTITVQYTPTSAGSHNGTITISTDGVSPNKTVAFSGTAKEAASVILHVQGSTQTLEGTRFAGDSYTLPTTAATCADMSLYGWYTESYSHATTAPSGAKFFAKGGSKTLTAGENHFYAVYADVDEKDTYTKITSTSQLVTGDYLIAYGSYCMKNTVNGNNYMNEESMSAYYDSENGVITNESNSAIIWHITKDGDNYTIYNAAVEKYLALTTSSPSLSNSAHNFTVSLNSTCWIFSSTTVTGYKLVYNTYFKSQTAAAWDVSLYKKDVTIENYSTSPNCVTHDLTVAVNPSSPVAGGMAEGVLTTLREGRSTTATATPNEHYTFSHWTVSGDGSTMSNTVSGKSTDNPVMVTMGTEDATLTAHFTEKAKCTVVFKTNGGSPISSTTYWDGETPVAPTLTDGTGVGGDACDETSDKHMGWTLDPWQNTLTQSQVDARTAANVKVYAKDEELPAITAEDDGKTITYHAVWAQEVEGNDYEIVTSLDAIKEGDAYFAYYVNAFGGYKWYGVNSVCTAVAPVTVTDGALTTSKTGDGAYTLQKFTLVASNASNHEYYIKIGNQYVTGSTETSGTDLSLGNDAYLWKFNNINSTTYNLEIKHTISAYSERWIKVGTSSATAGVFRSYSSTGNQTALFQKSTEYANYLTTCCDKNVTLADGSPSHGTITFDPAGPVETCSGSKNVTMTITPDAGYYLSDYDHSGVNTSNSPTVATSGSTSEAAQEVTLTFAKNTTSGTYTADATFSQILLSSLNLHALKKDNTSATIFEETGNNIALSLYPTEGKTASPADVLGHTVSVKAESDAALPANALDRTYTWSATVNGVATAFEGNALTTNSVIEYNKSTGKLVAKAAGTAEIIITANDASALVAKVTVTVTNVALSTLNVGKSSTTLYVGESEEIAVTYDPVNTTTKGYTTGSYTYVTIGRANDKITLTGKTTASEVTERVTLTSSDAGAKTATIDVTVKPLPKVTFVDIVHNKQDFTTDGEDLPASGIIASTASAGVVTHSKKTPTRAADVVDPGAVGHNTCEREHLHLVGWIRSDYDKVEDYMDGTGVKPTITQIISAGNDGSGHAYFLAPDVSINVRDFDSKTFYAVWAKVE